ncbi:hypothetical protein P168DRAFT_302357 [Aspergillus campestris IBT 28561]|uniref:Uncharacterized protein n=1 Tax=Aspergillus campestris (strain IBT 28561) TaxID=1392248 RepID=A0A2I1DC16_ASPC2|nr:uncharacterized protein P168DRAFT_302357 [Aspergillus campestris IBT 28561]PKY07427.1 hypothetical protein P168DRAFT_302357 [Aspergillus campestris IBT 28561]
MTTPDNPLIPPCMPTEIAYASISQSLEPALQGCSSPGRPTRLRRVHQSSTDEEPLNSPDGLIEEDLRAGGPHLCESPCHTFNLVPRDHPHYAFIVGDRGKRLVSELTPICQNAGINLLETRLCGRRCAFETNAQPALTFLVLDLRPDVSERGWIPLARSLRHCLQSKGLGDIKVEITNTDFFQRAHIFPCKPYDNIFHVWEDVATEIMGAIDLAGVCTIGCFRVGVSSRRKECPPTVLFGVDRDTRRDWKVVREAAVRVLDERGLTDVAVLIRKDAGFRTVDDENSWEALADTIKRCTKHASVGSSVKLHGTVDDGRGTLGGWLELKHREGGDWVPFAITCSSCLFPQGHGLSGPDCQVVQAWKHTGVPVADETAARLLNVDSPSQRDLRDAIQELTEDISKLKEDTTYRKVEDAKSRDESVTPSDMAEWKIIADIIASQSKQLSVASEFLRDSHHTLGTVFASSRHQEVPAKRNPSELSIRDWALIRDREGRCPQVNTLNVQGLLYPQLHCLRPDMPPLNRKLHKVGRSTGFTSARYAGLRVAHIVRRVVDDQLRALPAWVHAFAASWSRYVVGRYVVAAGDSGSLVFDHIGFVVGLLVGGSFTGDVGYFTHISDLVEHIKMVTGAVDVRLRGSIV